jgi:hypothetical protein
MTPQQKAQEIYNKLVVHIQRYDEYVDDRSKFKTIQCALIAVDEILESLGHKKLSDSPYTTLEARQYYVQVKQEIENL